MDILLGLLALRSPNIISHHSLFSDRIGIYKERLFISYCSGGWDVKELGPASRELAHQPTPNPHAAP